MKTMDTGNYDAIKIVEKISKDAYKEGYKDGEKAALLKLAEEHMKEPKEGLCIMLDMGWTDEGCPLDCCECVKNHYENRG